MKKNIYTIFFLQLLIINTAYAEVPFTWMQSIYAIALAAYCHLSPIHGMVWSENNTVNAMYRYGNQEHATIKLIKELFYLQNDMVTFNPTMLYHKPASYWKPHHIGILIAAITAYRTHKTKEAKEILLPNVLAELMRPQQELMRIKQESNAIRINEIKETVQDINQQNRNLFACIGQLQRKHPKTIVHIDQNIEEIEQLETNYQFLTHTKKKLDKQLDKLNYDQKYLNRTLHNGIKQLITYFIDSIKESDPDTTNQLYDPYTTEYILLTFLWKITNPKQDDIPKQDFIDYFNQLNALIDPHNLEIWINAQPYTKNEYVTNTSLTYEQTILATIGQKYWKSLTPPIITDTGVIYTCLNGNQTELSPGCMETSLRNFFNIALFNAEKSTFDIKRLINSKQNNTEIPLQLDAHFIDFYHTHKCVTHIRASELYNTWANILKKLPDITYMKPNEYAQKARYYEIKSCFHNVLAVCNHVLFSNNPMVNQLPRDKQLDLVCNALSRDDFIFSWKIIDDQVKKDALANVDYITLKFFINDTYSFEWQLNKGHSVIPKIETLK